MRDAMERTSEGDEKMTNHEALNQVKKIAESVIAVQEANNNLKVSREIAVSALIAKMTNDPQLISKVYRLCGSEMATDAEYAATVDAQRALGGH